jgi:hypothetical protein
MWWMPLGTLYTDVPVTAAMLTMLKKLRPFFHPG